jgi:hypothetical protein
MAKTTPRRPASVPDGAIFEDDGWCAGPLEKQQRSGRWELWYADGKKLGAMTYLRGKEHGPAEYLDPSGKLMQRAHYHRGVLHGKQSWFRVSKNQPDVFASLPANVVQYDQLYRDDVATAYCTLLSKQVTKHPLVVDAGGQVKDMARAIGTTILPNSRLVLVADHFKLSGEDALAGHAGSRTRIERGKKGASHGVYNFLGEIHDDVFALRFHEDVTGDKEDFHVDREAFDSFTLATEYWAVHASPRR